MQTLLIYCQNANDIKSAALSCLPEILDKINLGKPIFYQSCQNIVIEMISKELSKFVFEELLKWFDGRNKHSAVFAMRIIVQALETRTDLIEVLNLKTAIKHIQITLKNPIKEIWEGGTAVLKSIYANVDDSAEDLVSHLKDLWSVLIKELLDTLNKQEKWKSGIWIFS